MLSYVEYKEEFKVENLMQFDFFECKPFWGPEDNADGYLSNFYVCPYSFDGLRFHSSEQEFMYRKALEFGDIEIGIAILRSTTPAEAKKLGRKIKGFTDEQWDKVKEIIMIKTLHHKFYDNPQLKQKLMLTGDAVLVEASPYDKVWGIKLGPDNPDVHDPSKWRGENLLGFCLMYLRYIYKEKLVLQTE